MHDKSDRRSNNGSSSSPPAKVAFSVGMALKMADCSLGAAGPTQSLSDGTLRCTTSMIMAAYQALPIGDKRASYVLETGSRISTITRADRSAWQTEQDMHR